MSVPLDYNNAATLGHHLSDLGGLHHLYSLRHQAWYNRKERLAEFCILGRFYLDACGNFGLLEQAPADLYRRSLDPKHPKICPVVMTLHELELFMRGDYICWSGYRLPAPSDTCPVCERGWTIEDCHTVEWSQRTVAGARPRSDDELPFHPICLYRERARDQRSEFMVAFGRAGFAMSSINLITIQNEYWKEPLSVPWYLAQVDECKPFKIGWRKRVISIDWTRTGVSLPDLFEGENVTREDTLIHAWGYDKCAEYLKKLVPELEKPR